ncbi:MAG: hypothetical protein GY939_10190 [Actinomycetia bacterium]|nr:hypothetical protein [Actinomycetes bacterium]
MAIVNVTAIPMDSDTTIPDAVVVITDGRIVDVGPASEIDVPVGAAILDGRGGYLIPGLADMHFHADTEQTRLVLAAANGVTTVQKPQRLRR